MILARLGNWSDIKGRTKVGQGYFIFLEKKKSWFEPDSVQNRPVSDCFKYNNDLCTIDACLKYNRINGNENYPFVVEILFVFISFEIKCRFAK